MPMNSINQDTWKVGMGVVETISHSGSNGITVTHAKVTKITKTRVTVTFKDGKTRQYFDRFERNGWLSVVGDSTYGYHTTFIHLYPASHPDVPAIMAKARKQKLKTNIRNAARALDREINQTTVYAMELAIAEWKASVFEEEA